MAQDDRLFLIVGATGIQGRATTREMLAAGHRVRVLTRNPDSDVSNALGKLGAEVVKGDMEDAGSLTTAMAGVHGVFAVFQPDAGGTDSERRHGHAAISAAKAAGVQHFIYSSVCQAGTHESFPRWGTGYWSESYWTDKAELERAVRDGFPIWTLLRPTFLIENFGHACAERLFPQLSKEGVILTPVLPDVPQQLIAGDDIGRMATAAFENPARFGGASIDLAVDVLTMEGIAEVLSKNLGKTVVAKSVSPDEGVAAGLFPRWVRALEWANEIGYLADLNHLREAGIPLTSFDAWVKRHSDEIVIAD